MQAIINYITSIFSDKKVYEAWVKEFDASEKEESSIYYQAVSFHKRNG